VAPRARVDAIPRTGGAPPEDEMLRTSGFWLALGLLLVGVARGGADQPAQPRAAEDPRLARVVDYAGLRVYLGEAVEGIARRTGVSLRVADKGDSASGIELMFMISGRPLEEVMGAITDLLNTPYDRWRWHREGSGQQSSYRLEHEPTLTEAASRARRGIDDIARADAWALYRAARAGPDGLQKLKTLRPDLFRGRQEADLGPVTLLGELSEDQFRSLMSGQALSLPVASLSPAGQAARLDALGAAGGTAVAGGAIRYTFDRTTSGVPYVAVGVHSIGDFSIGSALPPLRWGSRTWEGWLSRYSPPTEEQKRIVAGMAPWLVDASLGSLAIPELLRRAAAVHHLSLVAEVAQNASVVGETPDRPLEELRYRLMIYGHPSKKEGGTYLFRRDDAVTMPRDHLVEWPAISNYRTTASRNDGFLDLAALERMAALRPAQWDALAEEFRDARYMPKWAPVLLLHSTLDPEHRDRLTAPDGIAAGDLPPEALRVLFAPGANAEWFGADLVADRPGTVLRLMQESSGKQRVLVWSVRPADTVATEFRFPLRAREPLRIGGPPSRAGGR